MGEHSRGRSTSSEMGWEPAAEPHIGEHSPCLEIGRIYTQMRRSLSVRELMCVCMNVHTFGFAVDWLYPRLCKTCGISVAPGYWAGVRAGFAGVRGCYVKRLCLPKIVKVKILMILLINKE